MDKLLRREYYIIDYLRTNSLQEFTAKEIANNMRNTGMLNLTPQQVAYSIRNMSFLNKRLVHVNRRNHPFTYCKI